MARVTIEDCILNIPNRFDLVLNAAQRAKQISAGAPLTVDRDNDKNAVVALREIADETVSLDQLQEQTTSQFSKVYQSYDRIEEDDAKADDESQGDTEAQQLLAEETSGAADAALQNADVEGGLSFSDENLDVED